MDEFEEGKVISVWLEIKAVIRVEEVNTYDCGDWTDIHADCVAQDLFGGEVKVCLYYGLRDEQKISETLDLLNVRSLYVVNHSVSLVSGALHLQFPELHHFDGDTGEINAVFDSYQQRNGARLAKFQT
jgi:hypothetical protein